MATNIIIRDIDADLHRVLKIRAVSERKTLQDLIKEILSENKAQKKNKEV